MSEQNNQYRDSALNLDQAYYYTLLLLVDSITFSYAVTFREKVLGFGEDISIDELQNPSSLKDILSAPFKKVVVGYVSSGFTLVPHSVINQEHAPDFARMLDVKPDEKVIGRVLDDHSYAICKIGNNVLAATEKLNFKDEVFAGKGLVSAIAQNSPKDDVLYLNITGNKADYIHFKNGTLNFFNRFEFTGGDDLLYFTASIINELNLQAQTVQISVSGGISTADKNFEQLSQYFPNTAINNMTVAELPGEVAPHKVLALMSLSLCASSEVA